MYIYIHTYMQLLLLDVRPRRSDGTSALSSFTSLYYCVYLSLPLRVKPEALSSYYYYLLLFTTAFTYLYPCVSSPRLDTQEDIREREGRGGGGRPTIAFFNVVAYLYHCVSSLSSYYYYYMFGVKGEISNAIFTKKRSSESEKKKGPLRGSLKGPLKGQISVPL